MRLSRRFARAIDTSIANNSTAYGYSVLITAAFGVITVSAGGPDLVDLYLYVGGAALAYTLAGALATRFYSESFEAEPSQVVLIGAGLNFSSIFAGMGAATAAGKLLPVHWAWFIGALGASIAYLVVVAIELVVAEEVDEDLHRGDQWAS